MRAKVFIMVLLIVLFLVGCDSEEEVDRKVQDYIKETYGFEVDITYRESLNEGNMGDRIYQVQRTDDPKVEFTVDLMGMLDTEIEGDNYIIQEKAFLLGENFLKKYGKEVPKLNISNVVFRKSSGLNIEANYNSTISTFKEETIQPLMEFINLLNRYQESEKIEESFDVLNILYLNEKSVQFNQISEVKTMEQLKEQLYHDLDISNESLKERDEPLFIELEDNLKNLGYQYEYGLKSNDWRFESFGCFQEYYENGECSEGYRLYLKGDNLDKDKIFELIQLLNSHPSLTFQDIVVSNLEDDERILFDDIKLIKSMTDIEKVYSGENESLGRVMSNKGE
ncbi:hypothetical protein [Lysinibacillus endophyticus]|uniref:hypothetical protein n=1 Tax=Ureibacillus endophyticus TaxID=1978490 RepID=UPI0020A0D698|nr:hypothetical protein [Lysinibacillus endophyticus]MCP1143438.1 hypothetical protein [Lysinibacillus endophyticus]